MAFDREEVAEAAKKLRAAGPEQVTQLRGMQQAAVRAEQMTGDPAWDTYLSYIQASLDAAKKNRADYMQRLASPQLVNPDQISALRITIIRLDQQIATLEWVIVMPSQIKSLGAVAKEHLDKLAAMETETVEA